MRSDMLRNKNNHPGIPVIVYSWDLPLESKAEGCAIRSSCQDAREILKPEEENRKGYSEKNPTHLYFSNIT